MDEVRGEQPARRKAIRNGSFEIFASFELKRRLFNSKAHRRIHGDHGHRSVSSGNLGRVSARLTRVKIVERLNGARLFSFYGGVYHRVDEIAHTVGLARPAVSPSAPFESFRRWG